MAEELDFSKVKKEHDEYTVRIIKIMVRPLARFVIKHTTITPNQVSILSLIVGIASLVFLVWGGYLFTIIGASLAFLYLVFDIIDGQIARVKGLTSKLGAWLDGILSFALIPLMLLATAVGLKTYSALLVGSFAALCFPLQFTFIYYYKAEIQNNTERITIPLPTRFHFFRYIYGMIIFFPLLLLSSILNRTIYTLWFFATMGTLFWITLLLVQWINLHREAKKAISKKESSLQ